MKKDRCKHCKTPLPEYPGENGFKCQCGGMDMGHPSQSQKKEEKAPRC